MTTYRLYLRRFPAGVVLAGVVVVFAAGCITTGSDGEQQSVDPHAVARMAADQLALVQADLDTIAPLFADDPDALRIIASARGVAAGIAAQADAYARSKSTPDAFRRAIDAAQVTLDHLVADHSLEPRRAERIRAVIVLGQLALNHLAALVGQPIRCGERPRI